MGFRSCHGDLARQLLMLKKALKDPGRFINDSWMRLDDLTSRLIRIIRQNIRELSQQLASENRALVLSSPVKRLDYLSQRLYIHRQDLLNRMDSILKKKKQDHSLLEEKIKELSPLSVLKRGYSITRKLPDKEILRNTSIVDSGDRVNIILADGELNCLVEEVE
jgi:exodeoxyribonuclease VII large subunit